MLDELISTLPPPSDVHADAVTQAISALMPQIAASDQSYMHRAAICTHLQNVVFGVSRGSWTVFSLCRQLIYCSGSRHGAQFLGITLHNTSLP